MHPAKFIKNKYKQKKNKKGEHNDNYISNNKDGNNKTNH
jgi:hypothetical protein